LQKKILLLFYYFFAKFLKVFTSILTKGAPFSLINLVLICICSKINAKFGFFIVLFVEMGNQVYTCCKKSRDISLFQENNNKSFKQCSLCQDDGKLYYQQNKENHDPADAEIHNSKEMSIALKILICSIGKEEYIEDLEHGIAFIQTITIEDFDGSVKEIADHIRTIISKSNGYSYM
jgi:hypothetical protein